MAEKVGFDFIEGAYISEVKLVKLLLHINNACFLQVYGHQTLEVPENKNAQIVHFPNWGMF